MNQLHTANSDGSDSGCSFNCNQGRNCKTRQACELPELEADQVGELWAAIVIAAMFSLLLAVALY